MFYSHTFLAKKGPLGTVWYAAHLHHKLKKSHYTSTNIPSTVERIINPEVPIALRTSSHLMLGVVRIYSKQVEYLYHDCNVVMIGIRKAFATVEINLPEAACAPFHSVTLPETFELDALDLDDDLYQYGFQDNHIRSHEEITLADQIPVERDYIVITFEEDILRAPSCMEDVSGSGARQMEEHSLPPVSEGTTAGFRDPGPSDQTRVNERPNEDSVPQSFPEIEIMRDASHGFHLNDIPFLPDRQNDVPEQDNTFDQQKDKDILTPVMEELVPGGHSLPSQKYHEPTSAAPEQAFGSYDMHVSFGHLSPELAVRSTPPVEQPKARLRKRKHHYDESTVLTNKFMKKALEDSSDLRRVRKDCPCSALGVWKVRNRLKMDKVFLDPLMTGLCPDLANIYKKDFISSKCHLLSIEAPHPEASVAQSPIPENDVDMEIEHLRNCAGSISNNIFPELFTSPNRSMSPRTQGDEFTPAFTTNMESVSTQWGTNIGTGAEPTPDFAASTGTVGSDLETPMTLLEERLGLENTVLYDIPELENSLGDLNFLEEDNTPAEPQGTPEVGYLSRKQKGAPEIDALSTRTRAVAQYLKRQLSVTPISENFSGDLSLNKILEGKRKKVCARMFFETLVLKNCGLVDVHQENPYGDITVKVTPKLSKEQFAS